MAETDPIRLRRLTWAVLLMAAGIRAALVLQPACIDRNGVQLIEFSRRMESDPAGAMRITTRQPGYSLLLLWTHRCIGSLVGGDVPESWQRSGEMIALAGGIAVCVAVVLLSRRLFDDRTAFAAAVLVAIWPQGAHLSAGVLSDMPHLALFLFAILPIHTGLQRKSILNMATGGAIIGAAYLIKQEAASLLMASMLCWWIGLRGAKTTFRFGGLLAIAGCFAIVVAPHSLSTGQWLPNKNPLDLLKLFGSSAANSSSQILAYVVPWWMTPARFLEDWLRSGRYVFAILFLIGAMSLHAPYAQRNGRILIGVCAVVYLMLVQLRSMVYGEISERYAAIPGALIIPWAASGWLALKAYVEKRLQNSARPVRRTWMSYAVLLIPLPAALYLARPVYDGKEHYRTAGIRLRSLAAPQDRILAHEHLEQIMFYAGRAYPDATWIMCRRIDTEARLLRLVRGAKPSWFVDAEQSHRDQLQETAHFKWLASQSSRFAPASESGPPGRRVLIYRVLEKSPKAGHVPASAPARP